MTGDGRIRLSATSSQIDVFSSITSKSGHQVGSKFTGNRPFARSRDHLGGAPQFCRGAQTTAIHGCISKIAIRHGQALRAHPLQARRSVCGDYSFTPLNRRPLCALTPRAADRRVFEGWRPCPRRVTGYEHRNVTTTDRSWPSAAERGPILIRGKAVIRTLTGSPGRRSPVLQWRSDNCNSWLHQQNSNSPWTDCQLWCLTKHQRS